MPKYQVVPMRVLMEWPSDLTQYPRYDDEFAANLSAALEQQAGDGWELVAFYSVQHHSGPGYAVFRRPD